jgi:HK97 family phage major capsid protein
MDRVNEYVTAAGSGSSMPLGALHASNGSILVHNRETSMSITSNDVFNMYAKHTFGNGQSVWLINRTALVKLMGLTLGNNTLVTWLPSLTGAPQMALLGLPVYMTDLNSVLGVKGDLALVNGGFYALALRQALSVESSIHYKFRNDLTAYRMVTRFGGIPIPTGTFAYKASGATKIAEHSPFVVLGDDATS